MKTTPVENLARLFGSEAELARAIGVSGTLVSHWLKRVSVSRRPGHLPAAYNEAVLAAARGRGISRKLVMANLDNLCPACEQPLGKRKLNSQAMRRMQEKTKNGSTG